MLLREEEEDKLSDSKIPQISGWYQVEKTYIQQWVQIDSSCDRELNSLNTNICQFCSIESKMDNFLHLGSDKILIILLFSELYNDDFKLRWR